MIKYQWATVVIGLVIAGTIFYLVRRDHLRSRFGVWWVFIAVIIVGLSLRPQLVDTLGWKLGIHYPPILLIIVGMGFLLVKILTMDIDRSHQERELRRLVQKVAILEGEQDVRDESKVAKSHES